MLLGLVASAIAAGLIGCQSYEPLRLTTAAVDLRLAPPTNESLRAGAARLHNPLISSAAIDLARGLTPGAAAVIAVVQSPTLRVERDKTPAADADLLQATLLPNPSGSLGADFPVGQNSAGNVAAYGLTLEWEFTALITHDAKTRAARATAQQVRLDLAWKEWQTAQAARQALYDVVALRQQWVETTSLVKRLEGIADMVDAALKRHDLTSADASTVQSAANDARVAAATAQHDLVDGELTLKQILGVPPDTAIAIDPDVQLPSSLQPPEVGTLLDRLEARRIDMVALSRGYESQEQSVRAAILGQFPKISAGLSHTRDYGDFLTIGPAITFDLPVFDRNQGAIATARATRQRLFDEYVSRVFDARSDVARAVASIRSLNALIPTEQAEVDSLHQLVGANEQALRHGNLNSATYYTAVVTLTQKQAQLLKSRQELVHAQINLELAAGVILPPPAAQAIPSTGATTQP